MNFLIPRLIVGLRSHTSSVSKRKAYGRVVFWQEIRKLLKANWLIVLGFFAALLFGSWMFSLRMHGYWLGLAQGLLALVFTIFLSALLLTYSGAAWKLAGAWGESNTRDVLRVARRKGMIWGWVDTMKFSGTDIDHIVVTKMGLLALDSKWHARELDAATIHRDVKSAKSSAGKLRTALKSRNLRDISIDLPSELPVRPAVVVWGVAEKQLLECEQLHDGVVFIAGKNLRRWVESECSVGPVRRSPGRRLARDLEVLAIQFDDMQKRAAAEERV